MYEPAGNLNRPSSSAETGRSTFYFSEATSALLARHECHSGVTRPQQDRAKSAGGRRAWKARSQHRRPRSHLATIRINNLTDGVQNMNLKHLIRVLMAVAVLGSASAGAQTTMPPPTTTPPTSAPPTTAPPTTTPPTTTAPSTTASFQGSTAVFSSTDSNGNPWVVTYDSTNGLLLGASLVNAPSDYSGSVTTTVESDGD